MSDALFQTGMDLEARADIPCGVSAPMSTTQAEVHGTDPIGPTTPAGGSIPCAITTEQRLDHFVKEGSETFAGRHVIIDLYGAEGLDDLSRVREAMLECVERAGATLLHIHLHPFEPDGAGGAAGVSGVAVLAESHISVHTWPEASFAAFDVFMCGAARPEVCVEILGRAFAADRVEAHTLRRGDTITQGGAANANRFVEAAA